MNALAIAACRFAQEQTHQSPMDGAHADDIRSESDIGGIGLHPPCSHVAMAPALAGGETRPSSSGSAEGRCAAAALSCCAHVFDQRATSLEMQANFDAGNSEPGAMDRGRPEGLALRGSPGSEGRIAQPPAGLEFDSFQTPLETAAAAQVITRPADDLAAPGPHAVAARRGALAFDPRMDTPRDHTERPVRRYTKNMPGPPRVVLVDSAEALHRATGTSLINDASRPEGLCNGRPAVFINSAAADPRKLFRQVLRNRDSIELPR